MGMHLFFFFWKMLLHAIICLLMSTVFLFLLNNLKKILTVPLKNPGRTLTVQISATLHKYIDSPA